MQLRLPDLLWITALAAAVSAYAAAQRDPRVLAQAALIAAAVGVLLWHFSPRGPRD